MNADHEDAVEFSKISRRENRVYVGNLSYDVRHKDLLEFMRGGGWGNLRLVFGFGFFRVAVMRKDVCGREMWGGGFFFLKTESTRRGRLSLLRG